MSRADGSLESDAIKRHYDLLERVRDFERQTVDRLQDLEERVRALEQDLQHAKDTSYEDTQRLRQDLEGQLSQVRRDLVTSHHSHSW